MSKSQTSREEFNIDLEGVAQVKGDVWFYGGLRRVLGRIAGVQTNVVTV